ncbi:MAG TPA: amidohydrolase family protein, partial [Chitinophagaceae bacterium]|nr:amidohydrolase family protein [Chitinophagaceae bacterium]
MKHLVIAIALFYCLHTSAQETIYPASPQSETIVITNAVIHTGNGQVLNNASIEFSKGKITAVGSGIATAQGARVINAGGKHVYPGLILSASNLGLVEVPSVRATNDVAEIGELNPSVRSIVAYNTDSKVTNTLRSSGILLANIVPLGSGISGSSSVVQLDAWNWEDAVYRMDHGLHFTMPSLLPRPRQLATANTPQTDPVKEGLERVDRIKNFLQEAKAYNSESTHTQTNLKLSAAKGLFDKKQKLYVHANTVKQMLVALDMIKDLPVEMVIVGGNDSWQIADLLKQKGVSVILNSMHSLPLLEDDDVDQPYKTPFLLAKAGVLFSITDNDEQTRGRNLSYNAGTAVAFGLTKEQALQSITLNAAKILGIADQAGSLEVGKDANIFIS